MFRTRLVLIGRISAVAIFVLIGAALAVYLTTRTKQVDSSQDQPKLQGRVVAVFNNTHYAHEVEGQVRFALSAGVDRGYEDGTHELEQVKLESYGAEGSRHDVATADRARVSDPSNLTKLDAELISNVVVTTTEGLVVKTSYLHYDNLRGVVDTKEAVEFSNTNLSGRSTGMTIEAAEQRVRLLKDVDVTLKPAAPVARKTDPAAIEDQSRQETPEERAARKARKRARKLERQRRASLESSQSAAPPLKREKRHNAQPAANRDAEKPNSADLESKKPTRIVCESALLEKKEQRVTFTDHVVVTRGADEMRADRMVAYFGESRRIERIEARGGAYLKQTDRAEVKSSEMDFFFGEGGQLERAAASGGAYTRSLGPPPLREARSDTLEATFWDGPQGSTLDTITAVGDAVIQMRAPLPADGKANPAERELAAARVTMQFFEDGRNLKWAEATHNAVLTVTPVRAEREADKKTIRAPQMEGHFYEGGNRLKTFKATGGVRVEIQALLVDAHPLRVTTSEELGADFLADSQDVDRLVQEGDFRYSEGDRNAAAERAHYDGRGEVLRLRGKRPMGWDSKARTQADELDYDRSNDQTYARGDVRTTYYSRETTSDSTPFKNTKSPVFLTAEKAEGRNAEGVAIYTGNARGWQDDNFVKADRIELYQKEKRMVAVNNVESALYTVKRETSPGVREIVPGMASANKMIYSDRDRLVHYEGSVKARQGTDRLEASTVDVYLKQETNEVDHIIAEVNVVLTQPDKRGTGDRLAYTAEDGRAVLTGKAARVESAEQGTTMGSELTFYSRDDRIIVQNRQGTGRVRSTHRLTKTN